MRRFVVHRDQAVPQMFEIYGIEMLFSAARRTAFWDHRVILPGSKNFILFLHCLPCLHASCAIMDVHGPKAAASASGVKLVDQIVLNTEPSACSTWRRGSESKMIEV